MEYAPCVMPRTSKRTLVDQIAANATADQAIINVTTKGGKALLPVEGKVNAKGDYVWVSFPAVQGFYKKGTDGNLARTTPNNEVEALFFPERKAELEAKAKELAMLKELAKKHGFTLATKDTNNPSYVLDASGKIVRKRTRAPRGTGKPRPAPKAMPAVGDKFVAQKDGIIYTVESVDGKTLKMKGEDGSQKEVTYSGIFHRWYKPA